VTESVEVLMHGAAAPVYAHPGDAGADLVSTEGITLAPGQRATVGTGVSIALPDGYVALVVPRSGLAARHGITVVNTPGTVDAGYRGEIKVILLEYGCRRALHRRGGRPDRQLLVLPVPGLASSPSSACPAPNAATADSDSTGYRAAAPDAPQSGVSA
jgi:deoxyuridine 5''-triphosphate nucleotidohydrolase (EC 3.6.1.23)